MTVKLSIEGLVTTNINILTALYLIPLNPQAVSLYFASELTAAVHQNSLNPALILVVHQTLLLLDALPTVYPPVRPLHQKVPLQSLLEYLEYRKVDVPLTEDHGCCLLNKEVLIDLQSNAVFKVKPYLVLRWLLISEKNFFFYCIWNDWRLPAVLFTQLKVNINSSRFL